MDAPDPLLSLDLQLFTVGAGVKLEHLVHGWAAVVETQGARYFGYGTRPWMAVHDVYLKVIHRTPDEQARS